MGEGAPSRVCSEHNVDVGGCLPVTIAMTYPTDLARRVM